MKRRNFLVAAGAAFVAGCNKVADSDFGQGMFDAAERWHKGAHRLLTSRDALAPEYPRSAVSPYFRGNGSVDPKNGDYPRHVTESFANWQLEVGGLVDNPLTLTLDNIRKLPQRTQITRHDCVEGWSAIGEWTGPQLSLLLDAARVQDQARFIIFRCADELGGSAYYESVDLEDAYHPQTIVAHRLNGDPLPIKNGAPLRMRIERQLGYKHAKYLTGIEAVASLDGIGDGKGGYWEDRADYQWYAGI
ncbi:molybdopterin-dependent oxidoreductase [Qipengyuania marisflavi]|uniref:Molybdopterin-binding protein n=1 Tax=Qipengyuania marisflavi TaxID=2486356 RepID=A0A5S3P9K9_9SPHN|nr:molybdopterin-dependent oxidoreductase [Qipengyuania marisflavi]TMM50184.1 molybdopterin-binding protein [Qipengyuania marisflavi]